MKALIRLMFIFLLLVSCKRVREPDPVPEELTKLECLYRIRHDSVVRSYDLSNDSLTEFPDLSMYVISSLDLSHNLLDTIIPERLPLGIEWLNVSHNRLKGALDIEKKSMPTLRELDVSHNCFESVYLTNNLRRLNVSHNKIRKLHCGGMQYIDVSYNNFEEISDFILVDFATFLMDTLVHEGIKEGKQIVNRRYYYVNFDPSNFEEGAE